MDQLIMSHRIWPRAGKQQPCISIQKRRQYAEQTTNHLDTMGRKKLSDPKTHSCHTTWGIQLDTGKIT